MWRAPVVLLRLALAAIIFRASGPTSTPHGSGPRFSAVAELLNTRHVSLAQERWWNAAGRTRSGCTRAEDPHSQPCMRIRGGSVHDQGEEAQGGAEQGSRESVVEAEPTLEADEPTVWGPGTVEGEGEFTVERDDDAEESGADWIYEEVLQDDPTDADALSALGKIKHDANGASPPHAVGHACWIHSLPCPHPCSSARERIAPGHIHLPIYRNPVGYP